MKEMHLGEFEDYFIVQPVGRVVNARECHTFWKRDGWTKAAILEWYGKDYVWGEHA